MGAEVGTGKGASVGTGATAVAVDAGATVVTVGMGATVAGDTMAVPVGNGTSVTGSLGGVASEHATRIDTMHRNNRGANRHPILRRQAAPIILLHISRFSKLGVAFQINLA